MIRRSLYLHWILIGLLFVSGLFLLNQAMNSPDFHFLTASEHGGTVVRDGDVLLPGEPISSTDRISVIHHEFKAVSSDGAIRMTLQPGSWVSYERVYPDTPVVRARVYGGEGIFRVKGGRVELKFHDASLSVNRGIVSWDLTLQPPELRLSNYQGERQASFEGWRIMVDDELNSPFDDRNPAPERKEQWFVGSLESGPSVVEAVSAQAKRNHRRPENLTEVFGYWVRDRWGNPYLYWPRKDRFMVVSAGEDQAMFTDDDRRWSHDWEN